MPKVEGSQIQKKQEQEFSTEDEYGLGLALGYSRRLRFTGDNSRVIVQYLNALGNEIHLSDNYKRINLTTLVYLSRFHSNKKFKDITKQDTILYLNSLRKLTLKTRYTVGYQHITCIG